MLVVVAHPDDEVLWFAGAILRAVEPVTVLCCSLSYQHPTPSALERSCAALGAKWECGRQIASESKRLSLDWLAAQSLDSPMIFTHNDVGEYGFFGGNKGHPDHLAVHKYVMEHATGAVYTSGQRKPMPDLVINLTPAEQERKFAALMAYDVPVARSQHEDEPKWQRLFRLYYNSSLEAFARETYCVAK